MFLSTDPATVLDHARSLLLEYWGWTGDLSPLPGENINILLGGGDGVLKIAVEPGADVDLEEAMIRHLLDADLSIHFPATIPTTDGRHTITTDIADTTAAPVRLLTMLPGTQWQEIKETPALLRDVGEITARIQQAMTGFVHAAAPRTHPWDLVEAGQHRALIETLRDASLRQTLETAFQWHAAASSTLGDCPEAMLHGDINTENILVDGDRVLSVLDFGDCLWGPCVVDLAIATSYAMIRAGNPLEAGRHVINGYEAVRPLTGDERSVLFPLIVARLATSAAIVARRQQDHPSSRKSLIPTRELLEALITMTPAHAMAALWSDHDAPCRSSSSTLLEERRTSIGPNLSVSYTRPLHIIKGRGQYLFDADDRPYLDLVNNVCHVGHCHRRVVDAAQRQIAQLNTNTRYLHEGLSAYAARLCDTMPDGLDVCWFVNSGSEANELALRLARAHTRANDVLVIDGAYHGSTGNCIAMSPYKFNGPGGQGCPQWVHVVPMPDGYRGEIRGDESKVGEGYGLEVGRVIGEAARQGRSIAAFFAETLLSCGGQIPLPRGYLDTAFEHVRAAGGVCVADEVQVGFGRTGEAFWGFELQDVVPDIVVMGKPIGNGHPMAAVVTTRAIAESFNSGMEFFSTFGGNPVSCAIGMAVLDVIEEDSLQDRARLLGDRFMTGLRDLQSRHPIIGDVRGRGLFIGIELVRDRGTREPADTEATALVNMMRDRGVLLSTDGPLHNIIKIKPPMVLDEGDVDMTIRLLDDVLTTGV